MKNNSSVFNELDSSPINVVELVYIDKADKQLKFFVEDRRPDTKNYVSKYKLYITQIDNFSGTEHNFLPIRISTKDLPKFTSFLREVADKLDEYNNEK